MFALSRFEESYGVLVVLARRIIACSGGIRCYIRVNAAWPRGCDVCHLINMVLLTMEGGTDD